MISGDFRQSCFWCIQIGAAVAYIGNVGSGVQKQDCRDGCPHGQYLICSLYTLHRLPTYSTYAMCFLPLIAQVNSLIGLLHTFNQRMPPISGESTSIHQKRKDRLDDDLNRHASSLLTIGM